MEIPQYDKLPISQLYIIIICTAIWLDLFRKTYPINLIAKIGPYTTVTKLLNLCNAKSLHPNPSWCAKYMVKPKYVNGNHSNKSMLVVWLFHSLTSIYGIQLISSIRNLGVSNIYFFGCLFYFLFSITSSSSVILSSDNKDCVYYLSGALISLFFSKSY